MRWSHIAKAVGTLITILGFSMIFPLVCGIIYNDLSIFPLFISMIITLIFGGTLFFCFRAYTAEYISQREGIVIVALGWTAMGLFGALPFYLGDVFPTFTDAFFESVSGFSTTGSTVLTDIEIVPKGFLFWRSFIQWLGGMGIIVLSLAILPFLGVGGMQLFKAEVPSPVPDKLKPRLRDTAKILWQVYAVITVLEVVFLLFGGMTFFDSICHAFTTMPTGGFSTKNSSVAYFESTYIDVVKIVFMILAGINFSLHYQLIRGKTLIFWKDSECRFFLFLVLILTVAVSINTFGVVYDNVVDALRYSAFQVVSIITTTGYATADYEKWPAMSQVIIFLCMFIGASAGSTGGGIKIVRIMLCFKYCYRELFKLMHPRAVSQIKVGGKSVSDDVIRSVMGFFILYLGLFAICSIILSSLGVDLVTSFSAVASCIGNIGPGFGLVGPVENFSILPDLGKWLLIWCMLLGRLEIYTVIILFAPEFWRK